MKLCCTLFILILFATIFTSCTLEKRHYRNGFYVNWNHPATREHLDAQDTVALESPAVTNDEAIAAREAAEASSVETVVVTEKAEDDFSPNEESKQTPAESTDRPCERADDPKPEGHDRLNPLITPMVGTAFVIPLVLLVLELFAAFPADPFVLLIGLPLIAAILFALSMNLRIKYVTLKSIGDKRELLRTSAHFHRFQILLYIYFAAALMLSLGFALGLTSSGILGWIGVIFTGGGIAVGLGVAAVLLVLFTMYWLLWRKDPTGIKPPRNPHPPKDR